MTCSRFLHLVVNLFILMHVLVLVWASLIAGLEYGMERWNGKWNGTVNILGNIYSLSQALLFLLFPGGIGFEFLPLPFQAAHTSFHFSLPLWLLLKLHTSAFLPRDYTILYKWPRCSVCKWSVSSRGLVA